MTAEVDIEISDLNKRKRILKGQLTRFEQFLNEPGNLTNKTHLEVRLKKIETAFEEFEKIQTRLEILDESEEDTRSELETRYYDAIAKAKSSLITTPIITQDASTTALSQLINSLSLDPSASGIKLPQIRLPSFAGDYQNWTTFHDTYKRLIHENSKLKNVEKLHHLKTCLKDVALKVIANLETTDDNYDIAWKLLTERFENKRVIINNHIKALLNLPKVTKSSPVLLRELTDNIHTHVSALEKLGLDIKGWEWVLICIISSKLDIVTDLAWEDTLEPNALPTYEQFKKYLTKRCFSLENTANNNLSNNPPQKNLTSASNRNYSKPLASTFAITERNDDLKCHYCNQNHFIYRCPQFTQLDVNQKYSELRKLRLCSNCLRPGHQKHECRSSYCKKCNRDHNTLLHNNHDNRSNNPQNVRNNNEIQANRFHSPGLTTNIVQNTTPVLSNSVPRTPTSVQGTHESHNVRETPQILQSLHVQKRLQGKNSLVLLSTAQILIYDKFGNIHNCRVLLDSGSQSNLISKNLCHRLKLDKEEIHIPIAGVNQTITNITHKTRTVIKSRTSAFRTELTFLVIPKITEKIPSFDFDMPTINYHENICLADPDYNVSNNVDILLGANIFYELLGPNQIKLGDNKPILQETTLGWILTGTIYFSHLNSQNTSMCHFSREMTSNEALNQSLVKFWQIEEFPERKFLSPEEQKAENYYCKTTTRDINGRFIVRLPFSHQVNDFGDSQSLALKRFRSLENRFSKDHVLKREYVEFMNEYKKLGHMSLRHEVNMTEVIDQPSYILPHHAVFKESSTTTKCRVVFDGSARSSLGISLNDNLLTGYTVQDDLFSIVMRLRLRKYVLSADIKMMFRQIWVHSDDRKYQTILWRSDNDALQLFTLNTVTYGTTCAPFLATRTLYELASLHEQMYPRTCNIIKTSFYMDDLLTSLDSIEEALEVYSEITQILGSAGFHLRKWSSNSPLILKEILGDNDNTDNLIEFHDNKEAKTLGIAWKIDTDTLKYAVNIPTHNLVTKRTILSDISKIFDPLGLVGPTIIRAKLFMQHLWRQKIEWDEPLSDELHKWWIEFLTQLRNLNNIGIQRQVLCNEPQVIEAHLFCDSSEKALGTAVYLVSTNKHGKTFSNLLCAKSKVAPQARCTLPRLELLSAVLLARLASSVLKILNINISRTTYYTDSTIVLSWLRIDPSRLKTFVANRVAKINELTNINDWRHVSSKYNPADVISRGLNPQELSSLSLWWHGPEFLVDSINAIQPSPFVNIEFLNHLPDVKETCTINLVTTENDFNIFDKFSCLLKLQRVISYCLRYKLRVLNKQKFDSFRFTADELQHTLYILIKVAQSQRFHEELRSLKNNKPLKSTSKILCLNPFLDSNDILRVGGRLNNSQLNFSQKHPILLAKGHTLTRLIIMHEHTPRKRGLLNMFNRKNFDYHQ